MRVNVTAADIAKGKRWCPWACPAARAIQRRLPGVFVSVQLSWVLVAGSRIDLPEEVRSFVLRFDGGEAVEPFSFELPAGE